GLADAPGLLERLLACLGHDLLALGTRLLAQTRRLGAHADDRVAVLLLGGLGLGLGLLALLALPPDPLLPLLGAAVHRRDHPRGANADDDRERDELDDQGAVRQQEVLRR